jgi:addiction module RelE/StbE family toxin
MAEITWTRSALRDLKYIHQYISEDSKYYADRFILNLVARVDILSTFPLSGRIVPEKEDPTFRELIEGNYRMFYKVEKGNQIFILRINHGAKNISK